MRTPSRPRCFSLLAPCAVALLLAALGSPARAATPQQVQQAIDKAMDFLRKQQEGGGWEMGKSFPADPAKDQGDTTGAQYGGPTALATYALLAGGESPRSPVIAPAIKFLLGRQTAGVYATGVRAQVWGFLPQKQEIKAAVQRDGKLLKEAVRAKGESHGLFYYIPGTADEYDHSVSQFGVLGMWALQDLGLEVSTQFWRDADKAWRAHQLPDGSWAYINGGDGDQRKAFPAMTAAGVATLFITQDCAHAAEFTACRGNATDANIEKGLKWMGDNFARVFESGHDNQACEYYALYGVERIGVAAGRKYLGATNWFETGADWLVQHQNADGSWGGGDGELWGKNFHNVPNTAFGLLFLARGRAPVVMNKLQYDLDDAGGKGAEGPWNQRPRDVANLARWMGKQLERDLNWQSVTIKAPVEELLDAPILYIAGNKPLALGADDQAKLKAFVEAGGLILGNADCGSADFAKSFQKLGTSLFGYEFRELPANHPIYVAQQWPREKWHNKPAVLGMTNGVRELMILLPTADPSRFWQISSYGGKEENFQLPDDIFLYAVDKKELRYKGETYLVKPDPNVKVDRTVRVARLEYPGTWDPEPGGWRRLAAVMHNRYKADVQVETFKLGQGQLAQANAPKIAHLTGAAPWKMTDAARAEIVKFVQGGGTLIVDAAGGGDFGDSIETDLAATFPGAGEKLKAVLPADHPLFSAATGKPTRIAYRPWARRVMSANLNLPRLRALDVNGRPAVFLSKEDLSGGLVGHPTDGINGYDPETATELMADLLLYADGVGKRP